MKNSQKKNEILTEPVPVEWIAYRPIDSEHGLENMWFPVGWKNGVIHMQHLKDAMEGKKISESECLEINERDYKNKWTQCSYYE